MKGKLKAASIYNLEGAGLSRDGARYVKKWIRSALAPAENRKPAVKRALKRFIQHVPGDLESIGLEALKGDRKKDGYGSDRLLFVSFDDQERETLMYDPEKDRFFVGPVTDWIENYGASVGVGVGSD